MGCGRPARKLPLQLQAAKCPPHVKKRYFRNALDRPDFPARVT